MSLLPVNHKPETGEKPQFGGKIGRCEKTLLEPHLLEFPCPLEERSLNSHTASRVYLQMQSENKADAGSKDKNMNKWELLQNFIICVHT